MPEYFPMKQESRLKSRKWLKLPNSTQTLSLGSANSMYSFKVVGFVIIALTSIVALRICRIQVWDPVFIEMCFWQSLNQHSNKLVNIPASPTAMFVFLYIDGLIFGPSTYGSMDPPLLIFSGSLIGYLIRLHNTTSGGSSIVIGYKNTTSTGSLSEFQRIFKMFYPSQCSFMPCFDTSVQTMIVYS